jgi:glutamate--cysteine ligase catalytic subunit
MAGEGVRRIPKSRYGSVSTYIHNCTQSNNKTTHVCSRLFEKYNDIPCPIDEEAKAHLIDAGVDVSLAHHVAHLFCRDPLVVFEGEIF